MKKHLFNRLLSLVLAAVMVLGMFPAVHADSVNLRWEKTDVDVSWDKSDRLAEDDLHNQTAHKPTDMVRVSIVLEDAPTLKAGYSTMGIGANADAMAYDLDLQKAQDKMAKTISAQALGGQKLDVVWNLTLVGNIISANVPYGKIDAVKAVAGVKDVVLERAYEAQSATKVEPDTFSSASMIGSTAVWQTGMTGAGTRIAIVDTGTDTDHQSFDNGAYLYALQQNAAEKGMTFEEYKASLDLLDAEEIASVLTHLNAYERIGAKATDFYVNEKLAFGANYVDYNLTINHDWDNQGSHGSHVAGIATANRYINAGASYVEARETVRMSGVAPDAQLITLKVFGYAAGPYDSDYFAAIEDAIWLGCDSVNLSLGSGSPGYTSNYLFTDLLEFMATTDTVVVMSAGNSGNWAEMTTSGYLYNDGVSFQTDGAPGSHTNSFTVASVDNDGTVGAYFTVGGNMVVYSESTEYGNKALATLDKTVGGTGTDYEYVFITGLGKETDYTGIDLTDKIVFCSRGEIGFYEKCNNAVKLGAAAVVVYNNQSGVIYMDLTDYNYSKPCVAILQTEGEMIKAASEKHTSSAGLNYYTGTLTVYGKLGGTVYGSEYYTMSSFSSWGTPGSLELKPEITAPGGNIWSVNGVDSSGSAYEMMSGTSMAAPQVTGMAALVAEYIKANGLDEQTGMSVRHLAQSLLMSTAEPLREQASGGEYYSLLNQGAGLARVDLATTAESYITVWGQSDGKVKAELGDDPYRTGVYYVDFEIHNLNGEPMTYVLSADLFTQDTFEDGAVYLDTWTRTLAAEVNFSSNGHSLEDLEDGFTCDLNGDGVTNADDAEYLLDHILHSDLELHANGDVNGDGQITTYDAHVLLTKQTGVSTIDVPANGSAQVQVELILTEEAMAYLDANYPTGAYIESFIYAEPVNDSEGVEGVTHSIPVLGYYGSWSEPSMYDVGGYVEYAYGAEDRAPYLYGLNGIQSNYISINYGDGTEYVFGGNPFAQEDEYLPERNAFNNKVGATLQNIRFTQIRNAADSMIFLRNADTGEVYMSKQIGEIEGAYYHTNQGAWQNTLYRLGLNMNLANIPEGTRLELGLVTAPEYYTWYDAEEDVLYTDWESLGEGAYLTTELTIDNTAPTLKKVEVGANNTLKITAQDNEYIAAVALMNATGTSILTANAVNQTERGVQMTADLSLEYIFGSEFLVAVFDYAENVAVYEVTLELDNERPYFTGIDRSNVNDDFSVSYVGMTAEGTAVKLASTAGRKTARAAEYVEGAVFEISDDNKLYVGMDDNLFDFTCLGELDPTDTWMLVGFNDLAYNKADGKLYGLFYSRKNNMAVPFLCTIDMYTGAMNVLGQMPIDANTMAIDGEGNFYSSIYDSSQLYTYKADVTSTGKATYVGRLDGYKASAINSMAWDHNTDELYWAVTNDTATNLLKVNPKNAKTEFISAFGFVTCGLYIAYEPQNDIFAPTDKVVSVTLPESISTLSGSKAQLEVIVKPWNVSDASVIWTTSDPSVVTVDESGVICGVSAGFATVTATSVLDSTVFGSCLVEVTALDTDLRGIVWDEEGMVWWSEFNTDTIPAYTKLSPAGSNLPVNATMIVDGELYASTLDTSTGLSDLYTVDPETFEMTYAGGSPAVAYLDLAYGQGTGYGYAVYFDYVLLIDLETGDYLAAFDWTEGVADALVGITYYGSAYNNNYGAYMDYFLILDASGNVYLDAFLISSAGSGYFYGPADGYVKTIGESVDYSYFQGFFFDGSYVFWSRFNEMDNVVELIAWDCEGTDNVYSLGYFADGVWPVAGLYTEAALNGTYALMDEELATASFKSNEVLSTVPTVEFSAAKGSLNAAVNTQKPVKPDSSAGIEEFTGELALTVTVPADATNGIITVKYDAENLICGGYNPVADAVAFDVDDENGIVTIAFADRDTIPEGGVVAVVYFWSPENTDLTSEMTVTTTELNQDTNYFSEEKVTVELPHVCFSEHFVDVNEGDWWHEAVDHAVEMGYMNGMDATHFGPAVTMNRAQFVTVLYRMLMEPEVTVTGVFTDVPAGQFYTEAAYWALEAGITTGATATTFNPGGQLTRTELVTFMYRFAKYVGADTSITVDLGAYTDAKAVPDFAKDAWAWAVSHGIVSGMTADTLAPMALTNRAQAAVIFQRFDNTFETWFIDWFISQL